MRRKNERLKLVRECKQVAVLLKLRADLLLF